jgi:hypothetical protein
MQASLEQAKNIRDEHGGGWKFIFQILGESEMRRNHEGKANNVVGVELKSCEHRGGVWVRKRGAETVLLRRDISDEPIMRDEEDALHAVAPVEKPSAKAGDEDDEQDPVAEPKAGEQDQEPMLAEARGDVLRSSERRSIPCRRLLRDREVREGSTRWKTDRSALAKAENSKATMP